MLHPRIMSQQRAIISAMDKLDTLTDLVRMGHWRRVGAFGRINKALREAAADHRNGPQRGGGAMACCDSDAGRNHQSKPGSHLPNSLSLC
jgi:hypothetical protein